MIRRKFRNELGNDITIEVERFATEVTIRVIGPTSTSENTLTTIEAMWLDDALDEALKKARM